MRYTGIYKYYIALAHRILPVFRKMPSAPCRHIRYLIKPVAVKLCLLVYPAFIQIKIRRSILTISAVFIKAKYPLIFAGKLYLKIPFRIL